MTIMRQAAALAVALSATSAYGQEVIQVDARNSAKFLTPQKAPLSQYPRGCAKYDKLTEFLRTKHSEKMVDRRLATKNRVVETWESNDSWTWVVTNLKGVSCVVLSGDSRGSQG